MGGVLSCIQLGNEIRAMPRDKCRGDRAAQDRAPIPERGRYVEKQMKAAKPYGV